MEFVGETLRAALGALAAAASQWLTGQLTADWTERYGAQTDLYRFPKSDNVRTQWAEQVGRDGFTVLEAVFTPLPRTSFGRSPLFRSYAEPEWSSTTATVRGCAGGRRRTPRRPDAGCPRPTTSTRATA
ncbi:hypothetical protein [Streptomyces sp. NPDC047009]|uniref:hypothetical protein n=1 Tax=unclassified Streptomyces TaxID=2593676 RepID=UPI0033D34714